MSKFKLGEKIFDPKLTGVRDAFHIGAIVVVAKDQVRPGDSLLVNIDMRAEVVSPSHRNAIADPFSKETVEIGGLVVAMVLPSLVSGFSHTFQIDEMEKDGATPKENVREADWCDVEECG